MTTHTEDPATEAISRQVIGCKQLPSLPTVALQILELTRDDSATTADIAACVELDQALAAKILKTINSSFYGLSTPCPTITRAINYLGMNTVRSLVLGFSLVEKFGDPDGTDGFDMIAHWRRSMYGAVAARIIGPKFPGCDPDEAFIAAMLRDVGSLAATIALEDDYLAILSKAEGAHYNLAKLETEALGVHHATLGAKLAHTWRVSDHLVEAIKHHHDDPAILKDIPLIKCVAFSSIAAATLSENKEDAGPARVQLRKLAESWFKMDQADVREFLDELKQRGGELARLFNVDIGPMPDIDALLEEAEQQKLKIQFEQERESKQLRESNTELAKQRFTDGLTGAQNRAAFDQALAQAYENAQNAGQSFTIAFLDADKFKSFNDTHGHQAGDAVLIELAARMQRTVGETGGVFRYGGEEFAFICENLSIDDSIELAERVRTSIGNTPFNLSECAETPDELPVTVSIGVAVYNDDSRTQFADPAEILKAADDAVYEAKEGGRNRTCLYNVQTTDQAGAPHTNEIKPPPPPADGVLRVLLVDDDPLLQKMLKAAMEKSGRAVVRTVSSVAEAVKLLHFGDGTNPYVPHLVITDLNMPQHSGTKLVRYMRATKAHTMSPIIVLSGSDQNADIRACLEAGANAYLPKSALADDPIEAAKKVIDFWAIAACAA